MHPDPQKTSATWQRPSKLKKSVNKGEKRYHYSEEWKVIWCSWLFRAVHGHNFWAKIYVVTVLKSLFSALCLLLQLSQVINRGLLLFIFWTRAESDCLHTSLKGGWIVDILRTNRRTMDIVNLICRQSLSALFQKLNNNNPLLLAVENVSR